MPNQMVTDVAHSLHRGPQAFEGRFAQLLFDGAEHLSLATLPGMKERTIFLHGFSKSWAMTGFRLGYSCAPPEITEAMMKIHQYSMLCASSVSQEAAIEADRLARAQLLASDTFDSLRHGQNSHRQIERA